MGFEALDPFVLLAATMLMPILTSIVIRQTWASEYKSLAGLGIGIGIGLVAAWWQGEFTRTGVAVNVGAVWALGQVLESRLFRPLGITPSIEANVLRGTGTTGASRNELPVIGSSIPLRE